MWAQYANDNNGVCVILNKNNLTKHLSMISGVKYFEIETINYKRVKSVPSEKIEEIIGFCCNAFEEDILRKYSKEMLLIESK